MTKLNLQWLHIVEGTLVYRINLLSAGPCKVRVVVIMQERVKLLFTNVIVIAQLRFKSVALIEIHS